MRNVLITVLIAAFMAGTAQTSLSQSFSLSISPTSQSVTSGQIADFVISITPSGGFQSTVYLSASTTTPYYFSSTEVNYPYTSEHFFLKPFAGDTGLKNFTISGKNASLSSSVSGTVQSVLNAQWHTMGKLDWSPAVTYFATRNISKEFSVLVATSKGPVSYTYSSHTWKSTPLIGTKCALEVCKGAYSTDSSLWYLDYCGVNHYRNGFLTTYNAKNSTLGAGIPMWIDINKDGKPICRQTDSYYQYDSASSWHLIASVNTLSLGSKSKFVVDSSGDIISYDVSTYKMYKISGGVKTYWTASSPFYALDFVVAPDSSVWGITDDIKSNIFHITTGGLSLFAIPGVATDETFYSITADPRGYIWVATSAGVRQYYAGTWTMFTIENSPLNDRGYRSLTIDASGNLWIVGESKVYVYNPDGLAGIPLTTSSVDLPIDQIGSLPKLQVVAGGLRLSPESTQIQIFDYLGNCVKRVAAEVGNECTISTIDFVSGLYFVRDGESTYSFVVTN